MDAVIAGLLGLLAGVAAGFVVRNAIGASSARSVRGTGEEAAVRGGGGVRPDAGGGPQESKDEAARMRRDTEEDLKHRRDEVGRLERRITETEADLRERGPADGRAGPPELKEREDKLTFVREQLEKATDQHKAQLERIAGMTSAEAKEQLTSQVIDEAKRGAMAQVREIEQRAREEGEERARKIVTIAIQRGGLRADRRVQRERLHPAERGHEGPHHRPGGPQHPGLRGRDRRQHHHRRHAGGRRPVVLRPGPPRGRPDDAREARPGRPDPAGADRGGARALGARPRGADPQGGEDAVAEVALTDVHPELIKLPGAAPVPDELRAERPEAPGRVGAHRERARGRDRGGPDDREAGRVPPRHREGRDPRGRGLPRDHRRGDRPAPEGGPRGRALHRVPPRRGGAADDPRGAGPDRGLDQRRPAGARRESLETYIKRLERLEEICTAHEGVEKVFAMQAGREVRVMVSPEDVDDLQAQTIARDIAKQVEEELQYPGQIKISVIRETRATEFAR